jgi:hypothetical protein
VREEQEIRHLDVYETTTRNKGRARDYGETIDELEISSHTENKKIVMFIFILHCS